MLCCRFPFRLVTTPRRALGSLALVVLVLSAGACTKPQAEPEAAQEAVPEPAPEPEVGAPSGGTSIGKLKFGPEWDTGDNNDYDWANGPMTAQDIYDVLSESDSETVKQAVKCGILTVVKGCHQLNAPHITVNAEHNTKGVTKACQQNDLFGSSGLHLDCWTGEVIRT